MFSWLRRRPADAPFTLIHLTHAKAGSSWIYRVLKSCYPVWTAPRGRKVAADVGGDLSKFRFAPGRIYPAMFMSRPQFAEHPELADAKRFVVLRDLRDTLVSLYFSLKVSHPLAPDGKTEKDRAVLTELDFEQGMIHLMDTRLVKAAEIHRSWVGADEIVHRYEDLILDAEPLLKKLFLEQLALPLPEKTLERAMAENSFEASFGRKLGEEKVDSHGRQGAPGNWRKHFTPAIAAAFLEKCGDVLVATGYEPDRTWAS